MKHWGNVLHSVKLASADLTQGIFFQNLATRMIFCQHDNENYDTNAVLLQGYLTYNKKHPPRTLP